MTAVTAYDFSDRPASLTAQRSGKPGQAIVTASTYLPSGPLKSLTLGNGLAEAHAYNQRYFPSSITLGGLLSWTYTTDKTGNISGIADALNAANNRTYGYQDHQYFLTQGNGPWGTRAWTYDRIGNRLTETRGGVTDTYTYQLVPAPGTGHSPILSSIQLGAGGSRSYQYDPAGNLQQIAQGSTATLFTNDDAGRLAALSTTSPPAGTSFRYDGRDYLTLADTAALPFLNSFESGDVCGWSAALGLPVLPTCPPLPAVHPTYSSDGLLHALQRATASQRSYVLHFAGRPVAQMDLTGTTESWKFLTVDHLGTPIAATGTGGTLLWQGGFEPFGADWSGAGGAGVFLRFPGQWAEGFLSGQIYNLYRWYDLATGRYSEADPLLAEVPEELSWYGYVYASPLVSVDPLGLSAFRPCSDLSLPKACQCDGGKVGAATQTAFSRRNLFCKYRNSSQLPPGIPPPSASQGGGEVSPQLGPIYRPQGDPCLDWCICQHERKHLQDLKAPRLQMMHIEGLPSQQILNWLECRAYNISAFCLQGFSRGGVQ